MITKQELNAIRDVAPGDFPFYQNYEPPQRKPKYVPLRNIDIPQGAGSGLDANTVMRLQAFSVPVAGALLALDNTAKYPITAVRGASLPVYANNAAALTGGLSVGDFYRTGANPDPVMIVH